MGISDMRVLRLGSRGEDVKSWELFLLSIDPFSAIVADGVFDDETHRTTTRFQSAAGLKPDGVVGRATYAKALQEGYDPTVDDQRDDYPPVPNTIYKPGYQQRVAEFGAFSFTPSPTPNNPEAIRIDQDWIANNIKTVKIPQLVRLNGHGTATFHTKVADSAVTLFQTWEDQGLVNDILSWGGSWVPRYVRGSRTTLSNHAWGTAFDINVQWNMLGQKPASLDEKGTVRRLVQTAYNNGWWWGGWFSGRKDGMHFERMY
jgi:peptidoglycan hydrolase-like protein with peptidoglycan-binding domain